MPLTPFVPLRLILPWPEQLFPLEQATDALTFLDLVGLQSFDIVDSSSGSDVNLDLVVLGETSLGMPGLPDLRLVLDEQPAGTTIAATLKLDQNVSVTIRDLSVTLRFPTHWFKPMEKVNNEFVERLGPNGEPLPYEIRLDQVSISVTAEADIDIVFPANAPQLQIDPFMIVDTGIVVEAHNVGFCFSSEAALGLGIESETRGVFISSAALHLPNEFSGVLPDDVLLENFLIGQAGISGTASGNWHPELKDDGSGFEGTGAGQILDFQFGLQQFGVEFKQNVPVELSINGELLVPYFGQPISAQISLAANGNFALSMSGNPLRLVRDELVALEVKQLSIEREDQIGALVISGGLEPLLMSSDGLQWPRLDVTDLYIDSTGKFRIKEAWLDLKELAMLDLWGFHFELRRIGIGYEDESDKLWVDLSGGLRLIEQIPVALDVEGFRLKWPRALLDGVSGPLTLDEIGDVVSQLEVSFDGIYLFFGVPDAVEFEGLIRFFKEAQIVGFAGDMALRVPASGFGAEAGLLIGLSFDPAFPFLYVYFGVELPAGIPLGQSGLALKGALGMFGLNVAPDKTSEQNWYYDWYKRGPIVGAHPTNKWKPEENALALGVGVTITTADGYVKGTRGLIVLSIPGPILIIEGRALILSGLQPEAEPPLRALAVFDGGAGTVQFNVEAEATLIADLLKAYGMLEAFFDFNDLTNWHLYLGQDTPRDRRIRADILKLDNDFLFKADAYLMIDMVNADTLRSRMGASIGFEPKVPKIDPLEVDFSATLKGDGVVTARPEQFSGELDLSANIRLSTFGVSVRLSADADFLTEGPKPLKVGAHVKIEAELPAPLDPLKATVEFEWQAPDLPRVQSPLGEIDIHSRLAPLGAGFSEDAVEAKNKIHDFAQINGQGKELATQSPIVEVDAKPIICFKQKMNSDDQSFARHPTGETHHYDVGLFYFIPSLTTIELYEHLKKDSWNGNRDDWTLIASTDPGEHRNLSGVWLVNSDPDNPQAPSPRQVQLWTDNPLSLSARALGSGYKHFQGAVQPGKSLAARILDDYPDLMKCNYAKANDVCVDFKAAGNVTIEQGDSWEYKDLVVHSTSRTASVRSAGTSISPSAATGAGLIANITDILRRSSSWLAATLLGSTRSACLFIDGYVDIQFRQRVKSVRITFCQASKLSETEIRVRVSTKHGIRSTSELNASPVRDLKTITLKHIRACNVNVRSDLTVSPEAWLLEADEGFDCIHIVRMDEFAIREICYTTVTEVDRARLAIEECKNNGVIPTDVMTLNPGAYYRLDITTGVRGELNVDDLPFDEESPIGKMLMDAYSALEDALTVRIPLPKNYHQSCFFQTETPPVNLRPYVKWCSPPNQFERFFFHNNIAIRFLRSNLDAIFTGPFSLKAQVRDTQGNVLEGLVEWTHAKSATLFPEESVWETYRTSLDLPDRNLDTDNLLLAKFATGINGLSPLSRYQFEIVGTKGSQTWNELVLFSSSFATSRFESFEKLAQSYSQQKSVIAKTNTQSNSGPVAALQLSCRYLARAQWIWEHAEVDYRFETLTDGRKGLEDAKLLRRQTAAEHEEKFRSLADLLADVYFLPFAENVELYTVRDTSRGAVVALWVRSPESFDVQLGVFESPDAPESPGVDQVGRTEIYMDRIEPTQRSESVIVLPNSDSTQVLILPSSGRPWTRGTYAVNLIYHNDYGDETRPIDHRYDRSVEYASGDSGPVRQSWQWKV